jgi:hypothetical protein
MITLLVCSCGDCLHWEILKDSIICKSCGTEFPVLGLGELLNSHVEMHPDLNWKEHEL